MTAAASRADVRFVLMTSAFGVGVVLTRHAPLGAMTFGSPYSVSEALRRPIQPRGADGEGAGSLPLGQWKHRGDGPAGRRGSGAHPRHGGTSAGGGRRDARRRVLVRWL